MQYELVIKSADPLGFGMVESIIEFAAQGAVVKPGTIPHLKFPHVINMVIDSDTPPVAQPPHVRVFELESRKEVHRVFAEKEAAGFSLDAEKTDKSLNGDRPWTKEELEGMDWESEFKVVMADAGIGGKQRARMTKDYLAKFE